MKFEDGIDAFADQLQTAVAEHLGDDASQARHDAKLLRAYLSDARKNYFKILVLTNIVNRYLAEKRIHIDEMKDLYNIMEMANVISFGFIESAAKIYLEKRFFDANEDEETNFVKERMNSLFSKMKNTFQAPLVLDEAEQNNLINDFSHKGEMDKDFEAFMYDHSVEAFEIENLTDGVKKELKNLFNEFKTAFFARIIVLVQEERYFDTN